MPISLPVGANQYRILLTGYATPIRLTASACRSVVLTAGQAISGLSGGDSADNVGTVLVGVGAAPTVTTAYVGIPLNAGGMQEIVVPDASLLYVAGLSGDYVTVTVLT